MTRAQRPGTVISSSAAIGAARNEEATPMPKYVIERTVAGVGEMNGDQLQGLAAKSNGVLAGMDADIQWVHSYVAGDRLFCVYNAESADAIREHARRGQFPCDNVRQVSAIIDPVTGEQ